MPQEYATHSSTEHLTSIFANIVRQLEHDTKDNLKRAQAQYSRTGDEAYLNTALFYNGQLAAYATLNQFLRMINDDQE